MITSFIVGRVRFRSNALKNPETMAKVESAINGLEGIESLATNVRTGSLLLHYNPEAISNEMLLMAATALQEELGEADAGESKKEQGHACVLPDLAKLFKGRQGELNLLAAALLATAAGPLVSKRLHMWAGGLFLALSAKHLYDRRKQMFK